MRSKRGEPVADAQVDAGVPVSGVGPVHVVAFLVGHHLERQLVVVPQEQAPLAVLGNLRRLGHDVMDREPVLLMQRHEQPRHQREMERHVAFVALAEVGDRVLGPLVGLGQEHPSRDSGHRRAARRALRNWWVSGRFSQLVPSRS